MLLTERSLQTSPREFASDGYRAARVPVARCSPVVFSGATVPGWAVAHRHRKPAWRVEGAVKNLWNRR